VYDPTNYNSTTGVAVDATGRYELITSPRLPTEGGGAYPPYPNQPGGPTATGKLNLVQLDPTPIAVSITASSKPSNPTNQTTASFAFTSSDSVSSVRCQLDGAPLGPCTSWTTQQYGSLAAGSHTFLVQATDTAGNTATQSYTWVVNPPASAPANTALPAISGTAAQGSQLRASNGTWTGSPSPAFTYQWQDCDTNGANCNPIGGATGSTYTVASTDVGSTIEVVVTAANTAGTASASSQPSAVVPAAAGSAPANTALPAISGTAAQGSQLRASNGTWTGSPSPAFTYQWQDCDTNGANCNPIGSATGSTYTAVAGDAGSRLVVAVTGTNTSGFSTATSQPTATVTAAPANSAAPKIPGAVLTRISELHKRWRETKAKRGQRKLPVGTEFKFSLNEPSRVTLAFTRPGPGRKVGGKCVAQTKHNAGKRRCRRPIVIGTIVFPRASGPVTVSFIGYASHRLFRPGTYDLVITATAGGHTSVSKPLRFTIVA
jgi:hypothetical protein